MQSTTLKLCVIFDFAHGTRMRIILIQNILILIFIHTKHLIAHLTIPESLH